MASGVPHGKKTFQIFSLEVSSWKCLLGLDLHSTNTYVAMVDADRTIPAYCLENVSGTGWGPECKSARYCNSDYAQNHHYEQPFHDNLP